jgi:hypothetical protein
MVTGNGCHPLPVVHSRGSHSDCSRLHPDTPHFAEPRLYPFVPTLTASMHTTLLLAALASYVYSAPVKTIFGGSPPPPESGGWLPASTSYSNSPYKTNLVPLLRRLAPVRRGGLYCEVPEFNMGFDSEECSGLQYRACQLSIRQLARRGNPLFRCLVSSPWHLVGDFLGSRSGEHARWYFIISFV